VPRPEPGVRAFGQRGDGQRGQRGEQPTTNRDGSPRASNGITGPHQASKDLGKISTEICVNDALTEIRKILAAEKSTARN